MNQHNKTTINATMHTLVMRDRLALENLPAFHPQRFFIEALLATTEYPIFFTLMIGEARNRRNMREQEKAKEEGKEGDEEEEGTGSRK